ncbi:MAG TPA: hypothetical protein VM070_03680, partial [Candidatus Saccharimonadales bacterium]|nr:hypothetical protein [Candidatus Saccharimonadales bacterium]
VARTCPNVTFVATTNHPIGVDAAFLSRADVIEEIGLPGLAAARQILTDTISEIVPADRLQLPAIEQLAADCVSASMDARRIRKLVLRAVASRRDLALAPERLTVDDVAGVLRAERAVRP